MWNNLLTDENYSGMLSELYRRAIRQSGYQFNPPLITEARWATDGFTTLALITFGRNWVHGYGITVKGPTDKWNQTEGVYQAVREALDNGLVVLKQKENHDAYALGSHVSVDTVRLILREELDLPDREVDEVLESYRIAVDHKAA